MCVNFVLLAGGTALNISADEGSKSRPPKLSSDQLACFKETRVAGGFMVMALFENGAVEGVIGGDVDTALVSKDTGFYLPVSESGAEGQGNIFVHGLKCLQDEWIFGGGRFYVLGEGGVDEVDEE